MEAIGWVKIDQIGVLPAARIAGLPPASESEIHSMIPPRVGEGGRSALSAFGFSLDEIEQLEASGAAIFDDEKGD